MIRILKPAVIDPLTGLFSLPHAHADFMRVWRWAAGVTGKTPDRLALLELLPLRVNLDNGEERPVWRSGADHAECPLCPLLAEALAPMGWEPAPDAPFPRHGAWRPPGLETPAALLASRGSALIAAADRRQVDAITDAWAAIPEQPVYGQAGALALLLTSATAPAQARSLPTALGLAAAVLATAGAGRWPFMRALHYTLPAEAAGPASDWVSTSLGVRQVLNIAVD